MVELMRFFAAIMILGATAAHAQSFLCEDQYQLDDALMACYRLGPEPGPPPPPQAAPSPPRRPPPSPRPTRSSFGC
jgi:hypothetical protein